MNDENQQTNKQTNKQSALQNDLISRQAAIEAVTSAMVDGADAEMVEGLLYLLPSAQPQQLETCPIYGGMCGYPSDECYDCPRHGGAHERPLWWTVGLPPFAQPQRWIPVTERLPQNSDTVLITDYGSWVDVGFYSGSEWSYLQKGKPNVSAWMPLPEPYKGGERMTEYELKLNSPITDEQFDMITDVDFEHTDRIWFHTKHGKDVEFVKRMKGRWIIKDNPGTGWYRVTCSECGEDVTSSIPIIGFLPDVKPTWDFCPNCGADMRGGE